MKSTNEIFQVQNFIYLCRIMDRNKGVFENVTKTNPNKKVFNKPIKL